MRRSLKEFCGGINPQDEFESRDTAWRAGDPPHLVEFQVPPEHWNSVLVALQPAVHDPQPAKWAVFGALELTMTDNSQIIVSLFELPGDVPGAS